MLVPKPPPDEVCRPILVVDDDDDARALVCDLLEREGYPTIAAADGKAALDLLMERKVDPMLIVLDLRMPTMSGWELVAIVKSYSRFASLPIIVITAGPVRPGALRDGAVAAWIQKPLDGELLLGVVRTHAGAPPAPLP